MLNPIEMFAVLRYKLSQPLHQPGEMNRDLKRCYELLERTSRSFSAVIMQLHPEIRDAVMLFYLILRALDTIEDDTGLDNAVRLPLLRSFRSKLNTKDWTFDKSSPTEKDAVVLREFDVVLREFHKLKTPYMDIIADITGRMGNGMADYIALESQTNYAGVDTIKDYDLYCHHVAGIVGEGLSRLAVESGFAKKQVLDNGELFESMGLFLQKTNIIRDYREDMDQGRSFWPKEVWSKYTERLDAFTDPNNQTDGLHCLSNMVLLSLRHVPDVIEYLENITDPSFFKFCAIPQIMSIATLDLVFRNKDVFARNVKISKGTTCSLIVDCFSIQDVYSIFSKYTGRIHRKNKPSDPNFLEIELECAKITRLITEKENKLHARRKECASCATGNTRELFIVLAICLGCVVVTTSIMLLVGTYFGADFVGFYREIRHELGNALPLLI